MNGILFPAKKLTGVSYHYNAALKLIYLVGPSVKKDSSEVESSHRVGEAGDTDIYVPALAFNDINLHTIETIQRTLSKDNYRPNIILAIVDANSTILYYRITNGLLDLDDFATNRVTET